MPTKEQIINNLREYSAADIVKAIKYLLVELIS